MVTLALFIPVVTSNRTMYRTSMASMQWQSKMQCRSCVNFTTNMRSHCICLRERRGRYLEPNVTAHSFRNSDDASERSILAKERPALFFCMPYFGLAPYTTYVPSQTSTFYPLRTLLQSWHMSTSKKRDMQQAICDLQYPTKGYVFHVPQLWCLMLGDGGSHHRSNGTQDIFFN